MSNDFTSIINEHAAEDYALLEESGILVITNTIYGTITLILDKYKTTVTRNDGTVVTVRTGREDTIKFIKGSYQID